jgi:hypothetical protein
MFKKGYKIYFKRNMIHWVTVALIICFLLPSVAISREPKDTIYPNAIKLNLAGAAFRNLSLYYERQINDRWSAHLGAGYKFGGGSLNLWVLATLLLPASPTVSGDSQ